MMVRCALARVVPFEPTPENSDASIHRRWKSVASASNRNDFETRTAPFERGTGKRDPQVTPQQRTPRRFVGARQAPRQDARRSCRKHVIRNILHDRLCGFISRCHSSRYCIRRGTKAGNPHDAQDTGQRHIDIRVSLCICHATFAEVLILAQGLLRKNPYLGFVLPENRRLKLSKGAFKSMKHRSVVGSALQFCSPRSSDLIQNLGHHRAMGRYRVSMASRSARAVNCEQAIREKSSISMVFGSEPFSQLMDPMWPAGLAPH